MIRKLLRRVFSGRSSPSAKPQTVARTTHGLSRDKITSSARRVTTGLQEKGYTAYIVGGAVRDLLLGLEPKDYDVATSATPEQVRSVFRRSRIIGRRFRLVHVMFGEDTIEVSTFRARQGEEKEDQRADETGRILRDNVFGTQEEDATRRDFTINALFYDPTSEQILDFCDGLADLKARRLRMIGDPEQRYREDPVRMLRAVRFAAKLGFAIDESTREPIHRMAELIENVPAARLFDEMLKLLTSGHSVACITRLRAEGLHHGLLPLLDVILEQPAGERFVMLALSRTDERVRAGKSISPGFLFATLLWNDVLAKWNVRLASNEHRIPALNLAIDETIDAQTEKLAIQRRFVADMREIWGLQPRFERRTGRSPFRLIEHLRFRAGYDFLLLRAAADEMPVASGDWWTRFVQAGQEEREQMVLEGAREGSSTSTTGKRRRRRRGGKADGAASVA
ncbi:MAG: polynucleotide adenylyltransferase PcnB [Burkholderiaceae bacterium]